jgi:hypothetical protein
LLPQESYPYPYPDPDPDDEHDGDDGLILDKRIFSNLGILSKEKEMRSASSSPVPLGLGKHSLLVG